MTSKDKQPNLIDYDTLLPVVHPAGTFETRPTEEDEIGYSERLGATAVSAATATEHEGMQIGDSSRIGYPAVLSSPYDLDVHGNAINADDKELG